MKTFAIPLHSVIVRKLGALVAVAGLLLATGPATTASAADLTRFDGRTVEFIVGSKPGGGYDRTTRLVAEFMERALPGSRFVVSNQSRMGGLVALNRLAEQTGEKPVLMMYNTGFLMSQLTGDALLRADLSQLDYIGKVTSEARYLVASSSSGIGSWDDVVASETTLLAGALSPNSAAYIQTQLLRHAFGVNVKPLTGFSGSESRSAIAKGELQVDIVSENNVERLLKAEVAAPILRFGPTKVADYADVRDAESIAETEQQRLVVDGISGLTRLGRIIVASPGIPEADLAALRAGFDEAVKDPEFLIAAGELGLTLDPLSAAETQALVARVLNFSRPFTDLVRQALE